MGNMNNGVLREAKRLYNLGYAIHWLNPRSKAPVGSGWTMGPRKSWDTLQSSYAEAMNVGVRLGKASKINDKGYLAVVDLDVKSTEERHRKEALAAVKKLPIKGCPVVLSGRGNGSRHYHCVVAEPFSPFTLVKSEELVKTFMPSAKSPSKRDRAHLTEEEIKEGYRIRPAWEISVMCEGQQVVLPPSLHPDTNRPYTWARGLGDIEALPVVKFDIPAESSQAQTKSAHKTDTPTADTGFSFEPTSVILEWLPGVSKKMMDAIIHGKNVADRSAYLLPAANALLAAGCSKDDVLTILTEPDTFLGQCAYDHAQTTNRKRAARWLWRYTLRKVMEERKAAATFEAAGEIVEAPLSQEEADRQAEEIIDWRETLETTKNGQYKPSLINCKIILSNVCERPDFVGRDEFSVNDYYLANAPWRSRKGSAVIDHDIVRIKFYCAEQFGVEFGEKTIEQSLLEIADRNRFHPVREWLERLEWDGVPRVDTWLKDYAKAVGPEPYLSDVSRKFLVAMIARIFEPGIKFDTILVLEGNQGTRKSTLLSTLVGDKWFTDAFINFGDKDAVLTIQSKWLVELGELSSLTRSELDIAKQFVAMRTDRIRAPYGKRIEEYPRQSVFAGTTNQDEYLRDLTGNRRFWTVKLTSPSIDVEGIRKVRKQLFAEAMALYQMGEPLWFDNKEAEVQAVGEQAKRMQSDEWMSDVRRILAEETFDRESFEVSAVASRLGISTNRLSPNEVHRITRCLKMIGCHTWRESSGARRKLWSYSPENVKTGQSVTRRHATSRGPRDGNSPKETSF